MSTSSKTRGIRTATVTPDMPVGQLNDLYIGFQDR